jgi:hypothetical protein
MNSKLKKIIKDKLTKNLSHVEIILHDNGSIWFIDRENKYWYLEFSKSGKLWWRHQFFTDFFKLFSIERCEYTPLISEWVEEILNQHITATRCLSICRKGALEFILNRKVDSTNPLQYSDLTRVEQVLIPKNIH